MLHVFGTTHPQTTTNNQRQSPWFGNTSCEYTSIGREGRRNVSISLMMNSHTGGQPQTSTAIARTNQGTKQECKQERIHECDQQASRQRNMASTKASVHTHAFGSTIEEENVLLQVLLQILQQLLPACAQPLLWSSAQAWQGCRLARNHCCGRQLKPGKGDENEDVVLFMANASPVPFDVVTLYESCGISTKHLAGWSTIM